MLFNALNAEALQKVKQTGLPYFLVSEKEQLGTTFAERYTNALESIFAQDFDNVISIGNDTPQLRSQDILDASQAIKETKAVLGPSKDGGFYLLGIHKTFFNRNLFLQFPWQKAQLLNSILRAFDLKNVDTLKLQILQDIDTLEDIQVLKDTFYLSKNIRSILWQIVSLKTATISLEISYVPTLFFSQFYNKGSPLTA